MMLLLWQSIPTEHIWRKVWTSSLLTNKNLNISQYPDHPNTVCWSLCFKQLTTRSYASGAFLHELIVAAFHMLIINIYRPEMQKYSDVVSIDFSFIPMIKIHFTFISCTQNSILQCCTVTLMTNTTTAGRNKSYWIWQAINILQIILLKG